MSDGSEVDDDLAFVAKARDALADGLALLYVSWRRRSCAGPVNPSRFQPVGVVPCERP
ncbi:hypothetical protein [Sinorhizobium sp. BJ1]|uniref:hypothetical protein n=1 Tax=Sinorhizobium sp. BJ1 TaxID=2035455 RepID=UPI0015CF3279|nr:hypothetical protein [Sinorhizobium sp. BJ1]